MTLRHMKIFLAVCDHENSVTKAAEALFMTQPAVSLAIRELEAYYGVRLFERLSRRLSITEAGRRMRTYAAQILALFDDMEKGLRDWNAAGVLRVGASVTIGCRFLPSYVRSFRRDHPETEVRVRVGPVELLEEQLLANRLDLALAEGAVHTPELLCEPYMEDALAVVCAADGPFAQGEVLSAEVFQKQRFLLREKGSGTRTEFDNAVRAAGLSIQPDWEASSNTALVNAAMQGLGVAVLAERMAAGPLERGLIRTVTVEGLDLRRRFWIVYHRHKFLTPPIQAFMDLCRNYERQSPPPVWGDLC